MTDEILEIYKNAITDLETYEETHFIIYIELEIDKTIAMNIHFHEDPLIYLKRYFITHYFPECYNLKILKYNISNKEELFQTLNAEVKIPIDEYKNSLIICFQHFLINPYWESVKLKPLNKKWHR